MTFVSLSSGQIFMISAVSLIVIASLVWMLIILVEFWHIHDKRLALLIALQFRHVSREYTQRRIMSGCYITLNIIFLLYFCFFFATFFLE